MKNEEKNEVVTESAVASYPWNGELGEGVTPQQCRAKIMSPRLAMTAGGDPGNLNNYNKDWGIVGVVTNGLETAPTHEQGLMIYGKNDREENSSNQLFGTISNRWFARVAGNSMGLYRNWKEFAFKEDVPAVYVVDEIPLDLSSYKDGDIFIKKHRVFNNLACMVSGNKSVSFYVECSGDILVDWGDGVIEKNVFTHSYLDDKAEHVIFFRGEKGTVLSSLSCFASGLSYLNVEGNKGLTFLNCTFNSLIDLNLCGCSALKELNCDGNEIVSLNLVGCGNMVTLVCSESPMRVLDLSDCVALESLTVRGDKLEALNLSKCSNLSYVECSGNPLVEDKQAMTALANSLINRSNMELSGQLLVDNIIASEWVRDVCTQKNWMVS